jgi:hypothetical protein
VGEVYLAKERAGSSKPEKDEVIKVKARKVERRGLEGQRSKLKG